MNLTDLAAYLQCPANRARNPHLVREFQPESVGSTACRAPYPSASDTTPHPASHMPYHPYRSRTEQRYAGVLDVWLHEGRIRRWRYEAIRLTLAPATTLIVDFCLTMPDGAMELHEVKGSFVREDGWLKLKFAAKGWPEYRFVLAQYRQGAWTWKGIPHA